MRFRFDPLIFEQALKQAVLELMVSQDGGIPILCKCWDGNASDNTVFKGDVWSFTVEPFSIPMASAPVISPDGGWVAARLGPSFEARETADGGDTAARGRGPRTLAKAAAADAGAGNRATGT